MRARHPKVAWIAGPPGSGRPGRDTPGGVRYWSSLLLPNWPVGLVVLAVAAVMVLAPLQQVRVEAEGPSSSGWPAEPQAAAEELCHRRLASHTAGGDPYNATLLAAYPSHVRDVVAEHERLRHSGFRSGLRDRAADGFAAVCFFEADAFGLPLPPPPGRPLPADVHTRLEEVVLPSTEVFLLRAGGAEDVHPEPLPEGGRR